MKTFRNGKTKFSRQSKRQFPFSAVKPVTENFAKDDRTNASILGHTEEDPRIPNKNKYETRTRVDPQDRLLFVSFLVAWPFLLGTMCLMLIVNSSHLSGQRRRPTKNTWTTDHNKTHFL